MYIIRNYLSINRIIRQVYQENEPWVVPTHPDFPPEGPPADSAPLRRRARINPSLSVYVSSDWFRDGSGGDTGGVGPDERRRKEGSGSGPPSEKTMGRGGG